MTIIKIKRKLLDAYANVDKEINKEINDMGCVNLLTKGRKLGLLDALFIVEAEIDCHDC